MTALNIDVSTLSLNAARRVRIALAAFVPWASDRAPVPSTGADRS